MADDKDIDELYKRTIDHEKRLTTVETEKSYLKELLERAISSNEILADTMHEVQMSMAGLNNKMEEQSKDMRDMKAKNELEFAKVNAKVDAIDEKGKFDIWQFIKSNWLGIAILICWGLFWVSRQFHI